MPDLADGESVEIQGSAAKPYVLTNTGGVYSCTCPAWMHQSLPIEKRTCKHIKGYRGEAAEVERLGSLATMGARPRRVKVVQADGGTEEVGDGEPAESSDAPPILLAHKWETHVDLTGWWMSEKLDGVRADWDGKQFISRLGNVFVAPDWFKEGLPETPLDGELWVARKEFQRTVSIVRRMDQRRSGRRSVTSSSTRPI